MEALTNARVLTAQGFKERLTVVIDDGHIAALVPDEEFSSSDIETHDLRGDFLLPGFIDVQVNGGGGILFNDAPTIDAIRTIGQAHRQFGTVGFLPTLISDDLDVMAAAIAAVDEAISAGVPGVLGIHLEGPFLNIEKKGVHDAAKFQLLDRESVELVTSLSNGKTLLTIAPEMTTTTIIRELIEAGVVVAAGHSNGSYDEVRIALDAGLSGFTHLFNAMSPLTSREPGVVGAALDDQRSWCGMIVDGHHVHPATMRIALANKTAKRLMLVTDAMPSVGASETNFQIGGKAIAVSDGKCVTADGTLAGSALDMASAVRNAIRWLDVDMPSAVRMASQTPAEFLGLGSEFGRIQVGYRADFVRTDQHLNVIDTWIDGNSTR